MRCQRQQRSIRQNTSGIRYSTDKDDLVSDAHILSQALQSLEMLLSLLFISWYTPHYDESWRLMVARCCSERCDEFVNASGWADRTGIQNYGRPIWNSQSGNVLLSGSFCLRSWSMFHLSQFAPNGVMLAGRIDGDILRTMYGVIAKM